MHRLRRFIGTIHSTIFLVCIALCPASALGQSATLTLLTVNDVYEITPVQGKGGLAELMTLLRAERATATHHLTTVNGDFLSPSIMSALLKGAQMIALFNAMGVDAVVFGNHEFDFGPEVTLQRMAEAKFIWLGTNVLGPDGKPFGGALATMTRQVGPVTVGLFGLLTPETARMSSPGPTVTFTPVVPTAQTAVEALRQAGADVIIALTHLSIAEDRVLAQQVPGISVILGGHDHEPITWYEDDTLIHKAGSDAHYLGRIDLTMEKQATERGPRGDRHTILAHAGQPWCNARPGRGGRGRAIYGNAGSGTEPASGPDPDGSQQPDCGGAHTRNHHGQSGRRGPARDAAG